MKIRHLFRDFIKGIKNVFNWLPIIWKDGDWDQAFFEDAIIFKLGRMSKFFHNSKLTNIADAEEVASEIDEVVDLLKRVREDEYFHEFEREFDFNFYETFYPDDKKTNVSEEDRETFTQIMALSREAREHDKARAYALLSKNIDKWWD